MAITPRTATSLGFELPDIGGDDDIWGGDLNANWELVDQILSDMAKNVMETIYPVGSLYMSANNTNPATTLGFGTWEAFAEGRAIVGVGTADGVAWTGGQTRGEADVALSTAELPAHNHTTAGYSLDTNYESGHTHSANPPPKTVTTGGNSRGHTHSVDPSTGTTSSDSHNHGVSGNTGYDGKHNHEYYRTLGGSGSDQTALGGESRTDFPRFYNSSGDQFFISGSGDINETLYTDGARSINDGASHRHSFSATTDTDTHSHTINLPAKTSSGESQNHTHSVTVDLGSFTTGGGSSHRHGISIPTKNTDNAGSGSAHNNIQPSIGVYVWKRTA